MTNLYYINKSIVEGGVVRLILRIIKRNLYMEDNKHSLKFNESYRPSKFKYVKGLDKALEILDNSIKRNEVQNCYLFHSEPGKGKTTVGRILANKLICKNRDEENEPCGTCDACIDYKDNPHLAGIIEIDGASNANIEDIRKLKSMLKYSPKYGRYCVLLDEAQDIKGPAASALLKLLEEPPSYVTFILLTSNYEAIPRAIRSRCATFCFDTVTSKDIKSNLLDICLDQGINITDTAVDLISESVNNCVRDSVQILQLASLAGNGNINEDTLKGLINTESSYIKELINLIFKGNTSDIMVYINNNIFNVTKNDFDFISKRLRKCLFSSNESSDSIKYHLIKVVNIFIQYKKDLSNYPNTTLGLELASIEAASYLNKHIKDKNILFDILDDLNDINKDNEFIKLNKKDLFLNMLFLNNTEFKDIFSRCDILLDVNIESKSSILKFLTDTEEDKVAVRNILSSEIPQKIKPLVDIDGFIVKLKSDN